MARALRKTLELVKLEKHKDKDRIPVIVVCSDCGANVSERCPNLVAQVEADYKAIVEELREISRQIARWGIKFIVITPRKGWTTNAFDATAITDAIKSNFARVAGGEVFQYEKWDPKSMIISLKQQL
jgi:Mg-chelatase subunit ChlD